MNWYPSSANWNAAPNWDRNFLGYFYIKPSHIPWEMRYGQYIGLQSLKFGSSYPCGHDPSGSLERSMILMSCITYNSDYNIAPYWTAMMDTLNHPWASASHNPGKPEGANYLMGDGSVAWARLQEMVYQYNGWAIVNWWSVRR